MNTDLEMTRCEISEQQLDSNILQAIQYAQAQADYCLYLHFGGFHGSHIKTIAAKYGAEIKLLRRNGPAFVNWLAFFIPGHETLLKINAFDRVPHLIEAHLKDDGICTIFGFAADKEATLLNSCRASKFIDFGFAFIEGDPTAFILKFVFLDPPPDVIRWLYKGNAVSVDFD